MSDNRISLDDYKAKYVITRTAAECAAAEEHWQAMRDQDASDERWAAMSASERRWLAALECADSERDER